MAVSDKPVPVRLGIDIGGTKCAVCIGTAAGRILARREIPTGAGRPPEAVLEELAELARALIDEERVVPEGIGVSCGGPLDRERGLVLSPPNLPGWDATPVGAFLEAAFPGVPVALENDANATALAEWRWGAGIGARHMIYLTQGTGIGGGLILDGRLYHGANDMAGEVGHHCVAPDGPMCNCGMRGCLEAVASGPAIARAASERLRTDGADRTSLASFRSRMDDLTARDVVQAGHAGDPLAVRVLDEAGTYLGMGIANLVQILNPEVVVVGTIAVHAGDLVLGPARRAMAAHAWPRAAGICRIVPAALGDRAQDLAAIAIAASDHGAAA